MYVQIYVYLNLYIYSYIYKIRSNSDLTSNPAILRNHSKLFTLVLQSCGKTNSTIPPEIDTQSESIIPELWIKNATYIKNIPKKVVISNIYKNYELEVENNYVEKCVGIAIGNFNNGTPRSLVKHSILAGIMAYTAAQEDSRNGCTDKETNENLFTFDDYLPISDWTTPPAGAVNTSSTCSTLLFGSSVRSGPGPSGQFLPIAPGSYYSR
jgi:hypothetical protein